MPSVFRSIRPYILFRPAQSGRMALLCLGITILFMGVESIYVQTFTTGRHFSSELVFDSPFLLLSALDFLVPLTLACLSRRLLFVYLLGQSFLSAILLHYTIFFYNPLTLATIYHSMHGATALGFDIFVFIRWDTVLAVLALFLVKCIFLRLSLLSEWKMPRIWYFRSVMAVLGMAVCCLISLLIYGQTGLSLLWIDSRGHRTATERRLEKGTQEAVRSIGYIATWIGEGLSGTYNDTDLIYKEVTCVDPDSNQETPHSQKTGTANKWDGVPLPPVGETVILVQVESLDFAALGMKVNGHSVLPFMDELVESSALLRVFAPHKVGSSNSDYELLNRCIATQNVMYYSYITDFPNSLLRMLNQNGYQPSVFHGLSGKLFNLREAYRAQGAKQAFFKEELLQSGVKESGYVMEHILDEDVLMFAANQLKKQERQAQFIISMSTHVPFMNAIPAFKSAGGNFARYVSSLWYFDQSFSAFYEKLPQGTTLIIWGDHGSDVTYPKGFAENSRHVPFILHVKGDTSWRSSLLPSSRARGKTYTLCELGHLLHKLFNESSERFK